MNKIYSLSLLFVLLIAGTNSYAQKVKLLSGKLTVLKSVENLNLEYDYSKMGVGKFSNEEDYIKTKKADYNKKEEGRGDTWEQSWVADRKNRFEPQFEELFNELTALVNPSQIYAGGYQLVKHRLSVPDEVNVVQSIQDIQMKKAV